jgi:hypothetical protein
MTDAHAHIQRLVLVFKTATMRKVYTTEERGSVLRFYL